MARPRSSARADYKLLTPCAVAGCGSERYPHLPICWEHWRGLPSELRTSLEQAAHVDPQGSTHLAAFKRVLGYYEREIAA